MPVATGGWPEKEANMSRRISILTLTAALAACALPGYAGAAQSAQDLRSPDARDAAEHMGIYDLGVTPTQDLRSPDARDAARDAQPFSTPATPPVADVTPATESGFDWGDAGIGAAVMLALLTIGAGSLLLLAGPRRRRRFRTAH
jgi:hypothetical protein